MGMEGDFLGYEVEDVECGGREGIIYYHHIRVQGITIRGGDVIVSYTRWKVSYYWRGK